MKIWKSKDLTDKNIYCYYEDLVRLSNYELPIESEIDWDSNVPSFGLGRLKSHPGVRLCQSDGIEWVHQNYRDSRTEINEALSQIGFTILIELVGSKNVKHHIVKPDYYLFIRS